MRKRKVLVYHKRRDPQELSLILNTLHGQKIDYSLLLYPGYPEEAYKSLLRETSLLIWHAAAESQGIALQEAMACNVPVLVCDVRSLSQTRGGYPFASSVDAFRVSAAPYFNDTCGIRIYELVRLRSAVEDMLGRLATFQPREFILENLSLERQARAFAELWERWDLAFDSGKDERLLTSRLWAGPPLLPRLIRRGRRELQLAIGQAFRRAG